MDVVGCWVEIGAVEDIVGAVVLVEACCVGEIA